MAKIFWEMKRGILKIFYNGKLAKHETYMRCKYDYVVFSNYVVFNFKRLTFIHAYTYLYFIMKKFLIIEKLQELH